MRKLLLLIGGSRYPFQPKLALPAFAKAHAAFKAALTEGRDPMIAPADCLDFFDDDGAWTEQQRRIDHWLAGKRAEPSRPEALLLYYVGHGGVAKGGDQVYLTINATTPLDPYFSSIPRDSLATMLRSSAMGLRKFLIIDCCFAAAVVKTMQSPIADKMTIELREMEKVVRKPNGGGLAALCASSSVASASSDGRGGLTQFTDALLGVLRRGDPGSTQDLSFEAVRALLEDELVARYGVDAVAPSSHFPDDVYEAVHRLAVFVNRAKRMAPQASAPAGHKARKQRKRLTPSVSVPGDVKQCTANALHFFPLDYSQCDCPLGDGGRLVPQKL